ncbi:MAG: hypothetical protein GWN71_04715, partial [Gammaproteobacteria bacterium]|nr:sulfotransferase [Gemmatimonadota bacterium]NIU72897.1 hypothetical protein [Gammaproteobacteria bacterium]
AGDRLHELRTIVRILEKLYGGPFLNKNNSHSVRVSPLSDLFPGALFVHVDRDLPATVDSILRGRRQSRIPESEWWGAPPPQVWDRQFETETERIVAQVWGLRETVRRDFAALPESRRRVVRYEDFCQAPGAVEAWVQDTYANLGVDLKRTDTALPSRFDVRQSDRAAEPEFRRSVESTAHRFAQEEPRRG